MNTQTSSKETGFINRIATPTTQPGSHFTQTTFEKDSLALKLDINSLVINVSPFQGRHIDWSSKWKARQHLAFLLRKTPAAIDLYKLERLPNLRHQEHFLLHFWTTNIPRQLVQVSELSGFGIKVHRHFRDSVLHN